MGQLENSKHSRKGTHILIVHLPLLYNITLGCATSFVLYHHVLPPARNSHLDNSKASGI